MSIKKQVGAYLFFYPYIIMSNFSTKIASTASVVALVATAMSASLVSAASEFLPYAELLADNSVIGVQTNEAGYRLGDAITRGELAKITANVGGLTAVEPTGTVFGDVSKASVGDLAGYIEALAEAGIVSTANANFRPKANVTRAEAVKLLLGALGEEGSSVDAGYTDIANLGDLAMYINRANELGVIADGTYFRPNASITRGEAFKIAANAAKDVITTPTVPPTTTTGTTTTGSTTVGALTVALDGVAAAQYVPQNASNVKVGTVKVTAGKTDVTVNSLTVNRSGLGDSNGLTISIGQNGTVVSESRSVNSATQDAIVRLNNATVIKAGTTVSFEVLVSVTGSANSQHQFTLKAVGTTAAVTGAPITLGLLNTTSYSVSITKVTGLTFGSVTSGKNDQSLGTVKFQAGAKDITMSAFTVSKTAGVDLTRALANVKVYKNAVMVGTATITSDKIYVTGLNTKVARNDTVTFELRADVTYVGDGSPSDDITVDVLETTDVSATEDLTGYATATDLTGANVQTIDLTSLDIVWTKNSTKSVTVAPGATNVVLFDAKLASSASFDVTSFTLDGIAGLANTNNDAAEVTQFTSLTLTVNGVDYDLLNTTQNAGVGTYTFANTSDKFRMDAGSAVNVKLVGNYSNSATAGTYSYNVALNVVKNLSTGNTVSLTGKNITGDQVTVQAPTLTLKAATVAPASASKIYSNASGLEIGRFGAEAKAEEVTVRSITLTNTASTNQVNDFTKLVSGTNVKLVNVADNSQVSATITVNAGSIQFTGMSVKIAKDTTANFKVLVDTQGDLVTSFTGANNNLRFNVAVTNASSSSTSSITVTPYATTKQYTASVVPPTVTLVKKNANTFLMKITNVDADSDVTLNSVTAQVRPVSVANSTFTAYACIRDEGSSDKCGTTATGGVANKVQAIPGAGVAFTQTIDVSGNTFPVTISKNSSITREISVDSNFSVPSDLQAEITAVNYSGNTETYSVVAQ
jgi:hypothetical protein